MTSRLPKGLSKWDNPTPKVEPTKPSPVSETDIVDPVLPTWITVIGNWFNKKKIL